MANLTPMGARSRPRRATRLGWLFLTLAVLSSAAAQEKRAAPGAQQAILWTDPGDIRTRDLFYGPGGKEHVPLLPVKFDKEAMHGGNPKFDVIDASGRKWRAKMGAEAQPETVSSRLLWAVGYVANENYYFPDLVVEGLPKRLHRGNEYVSAGGHVRKVRLQRHPSGGKAEKEESWSWRHNPFYGTREFNGLRVMMALIGDWDLAQDNNAVREERDGKTLYEVSDVGSTFGRTGKSYTDAMSKNNLHAYEKAKFIAKVTPEYVDFNFPTHPPFLYVFDLKLYHDMVGPRWIGRHIPREDVRWIASLLAQLSEQQIRDAFRAGGYSSAEIDGYSAALQKRIEALSKL